MFFLAVVDYLEAKYYNRADQSDDICNDEGNVAPEYTVQHKEKAAQPKHNECRHRYAVGLARPDGHYRLRQIAEYHTQTCQIAEYFS